MTKNYQQQKMIFLDNLAPDDLRNGESFNQVEMIIDNIHQALCKAIANQKNPQEFLNKALENLFREGSCAKAKAIDLTNIYLKMRQIDFMVKI
ncbi:MAG: hypothetical protein V4612_04040 [Pseudomonadota bacterium]